MGGESFVLPGSLPLKSTVLKVAHHSRCSFIGPEFVEGVSSQLAVISIGEATGPDTPTRRLWIFLVSFCPKSVSSSPLWMTA